MSRPRTWDADAVLRGAMDVFRARGFERTSLRDVERATGLHPGSLYHAYGSKAGLFDAVLTAYNERVVAGRIATHLDAADDPVAGVESFFASTYEGRPDPDPGCLVTNTAIESPGLGAGARAGVSSGLDVIRDAFARLVGEQRADPLLALYQGLLVLVRFGHPRTALEAVTGAAARMATA